MPACEFLSPRTPTLPVHPTTDERGDYAGTRRGCPGTTSCNNGRSKLEAEASRRIQRNSPSKRITETSPSPHSTPLEAASAQLLTKSEGIAGPMGWGTAAFLAIPHHPMTSKPRRDNKGRLSSCGVSPSDALEPRRAGVFDLFKVSTKRWGYPLVAQRLVDVEKRAISALGGLRGEGDRRGEGRIRTPSRRTTKTPVGALFAREVSSYGGSTAYAVSRTRDNAERPG
ncbi:hypothetical protein GGG16DRAFT_107006, partial [Schizophyllum commune]